MIFCLLSLVESKAQQVYDRWCFSHSMGIDFTSSGAIFNGINNISSLEGCISVCDENGRLLFYASPMTVWDSLHNVMPNGDSLDGHPSASLGVFSVPVPGNPQLHYIFTCDAGEDYPFEMETRYSIVNMALNAGLGDVENTSKNTLLMDHAPNISEVIIGCRMAGHTEGYWLFKPVKEKIFVFKITSTGINLHLTYQTNLDLNGFNMAISGSGRFIAMSGLKTIDSLTWAGVTLIKFDPVMGTFSDELFIPTTISTSSSGNQYAAFSPNENFVYFNLQTFQANTTDVLSLNLEIWDQEIIQQSRDTIGSLIGPARLWQFKLGVNDTIYINRDLDSTLAIATISNPDQINGPAVFEPSSFAIQLNVLSQHGIGLPNNLSSIKPDFEARFTCLGDSTWFVFYGLSDSLQWNFNDSNAGTANFSEEENPYFQFSQPGTFNVQLITYFKNRIDTIVHPVVILDTLPDEIFTSQVAYLCGMTDTLFFDFTALAPTSVQWNDGVNAIIRTITDPGTYSVTISNHCETLVDSLSVSNEIAPEITLYDTSVCVGSEFILKTPDSTDNYQWSTGDTTFFLVVDTSLSENNLTATLWLRATNACGIASDTMTVHFLPIPSALLPPDSAHCFTHSFFIFHQNLDNVNYLWSDSTIESRISVDSTTSVWLIAQNKCGVDKDTFNVVFYPEIDIYLGGDTNICSEDSIVVDAYWPGADYIWNTGSTSSSVTVTESGNYNVTISSPPCQKVASRTVNTVPEACDSECKFSVPNVFTPNADGINDVLRITSSCQRVGFSVFIYNRWGQLVYNAYNSSFGFSWDGFINGQPASAGTYFIVTTSSKGQTQRNTITLVK